MGRFICFDDIRQGTVQPLNARAEQSDIHAGQCEIRPHIETQGAAAEIPGDGVKIPLQLRKLLTDRRETVGCLFAFHDVDLEITHVLNSFGFLFIRMRDCFYDATISQSDKKGQKI